MVNSQLWDVSLGPSILHMKVEGCSLSCRCVVGMMVLSALGFLAASHLVVETRDKPLDGPRDLPTLEMSMIRSGQDPFRNRSDAELKLERQLHSVQLQYPR